MSVDDYKKDGKWVISARLMGRMTYTVSGRKWRDLESRCIVGGAIQTRAPKYVGCTNDFTDFQEFVEWSKAQVGYAQKGWHLDKDIIIKGNKSYSPTTCCFVPRELNLFFISRTYWGKELPTGVCFHPASGKYAPGVNKGGVRHHIGVFDTPWEAHIAYKNAKKCYARELAKKWRGFVADEVISALENFEVPTYNGGIEQ